MNSAANKQWSVAVDTLLSARLNASVTDQLPEAHRPASIDEAYALQDTLNQSLALELGEPVGYKIGCTTAVMQQYLKIPHPCSGRVFNSTMQYGRAEYSASDLCRPGVECEIAVQIEHDMPSDQSYTARSCAAFTNAVLPSIELVDDRWTSYPAVSVHSLIADNFFGAGCVLGQSESLSFNRLAGITGTLRVNGEVIGSGRGADILGHPYEALAWLANHQARRGMPLRAGDYVSLGSVVRTQWLKAGDVVEIEFEDLGGCSLTLAD